MNMSVRKRLPSFVILGLLGSCWKGLATDTPFLDIVGYDHYDRKKQVHVFIKRGGEKVEFKEDEVVAAADPAYDQTFKRLFMGSTPDENGQSGEDRLKGFLNSIFFPEAEGNDDAEQIVELVPAPTELSNTDLRPGSQRVLRMDVACRCYCGKPSQEQKMTLRKAFDVEMQTTMTQEFPGRLFDYGSSLSRESDGIPTYAIGILAPKKPGKKDRSARIGLAKFNERGDFKETYTAGRVNALIVDLNQKLRLMRDDSNTEILIGITEKTRNEIKTLGTTGKQWLSLLGMRYYMRETERLGRYWIPLCEGTNDLVKSGISALGKCRQEELTAAIERQRFFDDAVNTATQKLQEEMKKQAEEIARLKELLAKETKKRDDQSMENLKKHGGSPEAVALLQGDASSDPSKEVS